MDFSTDLNIYFPEAYATDLADWGATFQAIIDAMPAEGGTIWLRPVTYTVSTQVNVNKPVKFMGHGTGDQYGFSGGTRIVTTSSTLKVFYLTAGGVSFEHLVIENKSTTTPVDGSAGVYAAAGAAMPMYGNPDEYKTGHYFRKCAFIGFYHNLYFKSGYLFGIDACHFRDMVKGAIWVESVALSDAGDSWIANSHFFPRNVPTSLEIGIQQVSSGGLRVENCKFNSLAYAYSGYLNGTSILKFNNCSFENFRQKAIEVMAPAEMVSINNCQFAPYGVTPVCHIDIKGTAASTIKGVNITGNTFKGLAEEDIYRLDYCEGVTTKPNTFIYNYGARVITNCTGVNLDL